MNNLTFHNILDYGAVADGKTLCTDAFKKAFNACEEKGGGTVFVPAGEYLTGAIIFKSNITLHIDNGAVVKFSQDPKDYPIVTERWEGVEVKCHCGLLYADGVENIAVVGQGTLDGQGQPWWKKHKDGTLDYPRPRFINFCSSKRILLDGVKLIDSPSWTINPILSENITINNLFILNPADSPNTDGIDPESCKNVRISNCHVDVGDDCIAVKAGTEFCLKRVPCENISITNCTMVHGHGGVVLGSEMSGSIRNVTISNCVFEGTDRGIRLKSRRGRGGVVEDVRVTNIVMKEVVCPFTMNLYYHCGPGGKEKIVWDKSPYPISEITPSFRRIHFSNITAREVSAAAGFLYGLAEMHVQDISFDNISVHIAENAIPGEPDMLTNMDLVAKKGFILNNFADIRFTNVSVNGQEGPAFLVEDGENIDFQGCTAGNDAGAVITLTNVKTARIDCFSKDKTAILESKNENIFVNGEKLA